MQIIRRTPICRSGMRLYTMYIRIEFNGKLAITGTPRHPKRDIMDTGKIKFHCTLLGKGYCGEWVESMGVARGHG